MSRLDAFTSAFSGSVPSTPALDRALEAFINDARAHGPAISADEETFCAFVAGFVEASEDPVVALTQLRAADLLGVFGCLHHDTAAVTWFRDLVMGVLRKVMASRESDAPDDAFQALFCRVFLPGDDGKDPRVLAYDGRRDFGAWARTLARNAAIDELRRARPVTPLEHAHVERVGEMLDDQETSYLRETCWAEFKAALADAFTGLQPRQRNVLRCHLQGLTADQIARMYRVHRVTVARWLAAIRFALLEATRDGLRVRLAGDERSVDSIVRMVDLDLTASLTRLVGEAEG